MPGLEKRPPLRGCVPEVQTDEPRYLGWSPKFEIWMVACKELPVDSQPPKGAAVLLAPAFAGAPDPSSATALTDRHWGMPGARRAAAPPPAGL
jgi:hypothetical protein